MSNNDDLLLQLVKEIHSNQADVMKQLSQLNVLHDRLRHDLEAGRNGYQPHEVVSILHWANDKIEAEQKQKQDVKTALTNWIVPIIGTVFIVGVAILIKGYL